MGAIQMLHLGDCLDVMQGIPDGSVDMVCTDPPYGTTACKWDSVIPFAPMWAQVWRVVKPKGFVALTAVQPFSSAITMSQVEFFKYEWIWRKSKATGHLNAKKLPMRQHEVILIFSKGSVSYNPQMIDKGLKARAAQKTVNSKGSYGNFDEGIFRTVPYNLGYPKTVIDFNDAFHDREAGLHPTQKPVALMEYLIRTYTNPGETVLDFTMGSGTTGVAAANTGRRFIGIELDADYFNAASTRIQKAQADAITNKMREATQ